MCVEELAERVRKLGYTLGSNIADAFMTIVFLTAAAMLLFILMRLGTDYKQKRGIFRKRGR